MKSTLVSVAALAIAIVVIFMVMSVNQKIMANCVVSADVNASLSHAFQSKDIFTGQTYLTSRSTNNFYQDRIECIVLNKSIGADFDTELKQLQSLPFIESVAKNKAGEWCATSIVDKDFCA